MRSRGKVKGLGKCKGKGMEIARDMEIVPIKVTIVKIC